MNNLFKKWNSISIILRIMAGLIIGTILAITIPDLASPVVIFGNLFVGGLKAVAPILVFFLVMSAISQHKQGKKTNMKSIIFLYLLGTFSASLLAVIVSFAFPLTLSLTADAAQQAAPGNVGEVLQTLLMNMVDNPVSALYNGNYIGILFWALILGSALKSSSDSTKKVVSDFSDALSNVVKLVISFAPFGIMGLVFDSITSTGIESLKEYGVLILVLVGTMAAMALIVNPIIVFFAIRKKPIPSCF